MKIFRLTQVLISTLLTAALISITASSIAHSAEPQVSGVVTLHKGVEKTLTENGTLFIIAKNPNAMQGQPPVAVLKIQNPKFPQEFTLSGKNAMIPGSPFVGPLKITARFSPSGDALDKSGPEGTDTNKKPIDVGATGIKIELKKR